jgi:hypothetical protein
MMNINENLEIVESATKELVEHPQYVLDAIEKMNLPHPEYDG